MANRDESAVESITALTAADLAARIKSSEFSALEVTEAHIKRIEQVNTQLNAVVAPLFDEARARAAEADRILKNGRPPGPLHGVPITIKEQFDVAGTETTVGVPAQTGRKAEKDGPLVARLREAGAIILGKTNVMMTLMGWESDNPVFGRTNNPWNLDRTPGGSSGGEAAIIAVRGSALGLGGDLGGSIRVPAHFCGVHGFKPTSGRLTNTDTPAHLFCSGQENILPQPGPIGRSVADLALMMKVLADPPVQRTADIVPPVQWPDPDRVSVEGLRVGMFTDNGVFPISPVLRRAVEESAEALRGKGAVVDSFEPPDMNEAWVLFVEILTSGGDEVFKRVLAGSPPHKLLKPLINASKMPGPLRRFVASLMEKKGQKHLASVLRAADGKRSSWDYWRVVERRNIYREKFLRALDEQQFDAVLSPPYATVAPPHGATEHLLPAAGSYCILYNVLGLPAGVVSVTVVQEGEEDIRLQNSRERSVQTAADVSKGSAGLPVGVQVAAPHWREDVVLKIMGTIEEHFKTESTYPLNRELPV